MTPQNIEIRPSTELVKCNSSTNNNMNKTAKKSKKRFLKWKATTSKIKCSEKDATGSCHNKPSTLKECLQILKNSNSFTTREKSSTQMHLLQKKQLQRMLPVVVRKVVKEKNLLKRVVKERVKVKVTVVPKLMLQVDSEQKQGLLS